jgi:hypothetical protein
MKRMPVKTVMMKLMTLQIKNRQFLEKMIKHLKNMIQMIKKNVLLVY